MHTVDAHAVSQLVEKDIAGLGNSYMCIDAAAVTAFFPVAELARLAGQLKEARIVNLVFRCDDAVCKAGQCQMGFDGGAWWVFAGYHAVEQREIR